MAGEEAAQGGLIKNWLWMPQFRPRKLVPHCSSGILFGVTTLYLPTPIPISWDHIQGRSLITINPCISCRTSMIKRTSHSHPFTKISPVPWYIQNNTNPFPVGFWCFNPRLYFPCFLTINHLMDIHIYCIAIYFILFSPINRIDYIWWHLITFDSRTCWVGDGSSPFLSGIVQVTGRAVGPWPPPQAPGWAPWPAETGAASTGVVVSEVFFLGGNRRETWRLGDPPRKPMEKPWRSMKNPQIMCLHWTRNRFSRWGLQFTCLQWISQEGGSILYVVKWCMTPVPIKLLSHQVLSLLMPRSYLIHLVWA